MARAPSGLRGRWRLPARRAGGFSLIELAVVLVIAGAILVIGSRTLFWTSEAQSLRKARVAMEDTARAVVAFSRTHHRLPCPAVPGLAPGDPGFGLEDCNNGNPGEVPHRTLLLEGPAIDTSHRPLVYALYRNALANADLGVRLNRFDGIDEPQSVINVYDFCTALRNAPVSAGTGFASTSTDFTGGGCSGNAFMNQAFVLVSAGLADASGSGSPFDGNNEANPDMCFASPEQGRSADYDDQVVAVSFTTLLGAVCP